MTEKERALQQAENIITRTSEEIEALNYAIYLVSKKNKEALDMVREVPNNIYINEWKREAEQTAKRLEILQQLLNKKSRELSAWVEEADRIANDKPLY